LPHAAFADLGRDFVDAEAGAGSESQTAGSIAVSVARTRSIASNGVLATNGFPEGSVVIARLSRSSPCGPRRD
jgi:hypothetical protein